MGTIRTTLPPTVDLSRWIVSQSPRRQPEAGPSSYLSLFEVIDVDEDDESRPAGQGPKRTRDAEEEEQEKEKEQGLKKREGETRRRKKPSRTGRFHNPKCERCERSGKSCEKQKTGIACYQCAARRARCVPKGESGGKPIRTVVEKLAPAPASRAAPQPSSPTTTPQIPPQSTQTRFVCDKNYYHESGDLAFVVEDTLFKVHRFQLERCSPSFADKLLPPSEKQLLKETVAENGAFILQDKVDEFRALCWVLYAPPQETALQYNASKFKLKLILNLFLISHKYDFESLQTFATQLLIYHCTPPKTTCRTPELEDILRLAIRNRALPLTKVIEQALLCRLEEDQTISIAQLITLAEELGMREFQGKLYYHELIREEASVLLKIPSSTAYDFPSTNLTEKQSLALFRGYRSLLHYWQDLPGRVRKKKLFQFTSCKNHHKCQSEWDSAWSAETVQNRDPFPPLNFDILTSLEKIQTSAPDGFVTAAPIVFGQPNTQPWMRACGQKELGDLIKQLKDTLADHFLGSQLP